MVEGLRALGYVEGRNVAFEYRFANTDYKRLPALAAELVALRPDVVYTLSTAGADAAAKATTTIPIVVGPVGDETMNRLAGNLARPVGNVTGQTLGGLEQNQKCLQLLKELAPRTSRVAVIHNPDNPISVRILGALGPAAAQLGVTLTSASWHTISLTYRRRSRPSRPAVPMRFSCSPKARLRPPLRFASTSASGP